MKYLSEKISWRLLLVIAAVAVVIVTSIAYFNRGGTPVRDDMSEYEVSGDTVIAPDDSGEQLVAGGETVDGELVTEQQRIEKIMDGVAGYDRIEIVQFFNGTDMNYLATHGYYGGIYNSDGQMSSSSSDDEHLDSTVNQLAADCLANHEEEIESFFETEKGQYLAQYSETGSERGPYLDVTDWFPGSVDVDDDGEIKTFDIAAVIASPAMSGRIDAREIMVFSSDVYETDDGQRYYADAVRFVLSGSWR